MSKDSGPMSALENYVLFILVLVAIAIMHIHVDHQLDALGAQIEELHR